MEIKQDENETLIHLDDLTKISELNSLAVENLFEEKIEAAIEILKKCEILLEVRIVH